MEEGSSQLMIVTSPIPPPLIGPIIDIPDSPHHQEFYSTDEVNEERAKLKVDQVEV